LRSRFSQKISFKDLTPTSVGAMLASNLSSTFDMIVDASAETLLPVLCKQLADAPQFGNGRDVDNWSKRIAQKTSTRLCSSDVSLETLVTLEDIQEALQEILENKTSQKANSRPENTASILPVAASAPSVLTPLQPHVTTTTIAAVQDCDVVEEATNCGEEPKNPFNGMARESLSALQNVLDSLQLNSKSGVEELASLSPPAAGFARVVQALVRELNISEAEATTMVEGWQAAQLDVQQEILRASKQTSLRPIWRCGVCGRADKPWIACYVAPFIVRYEEIPQ
jgi:hypothetical protein